MNESVEYIDNNLLSKLSIFPIAKLHENPNKCDLAIKALAMHKSPIKHYKKDYCEGIYFSINLHDSSGEIRATAFRNVCNKFYNIIQDGESYYIRNFLLKRANKKFTENDYEIEFTAYTEIKKCMEDVKSVPYVKYNFVPIKNIASRAPNCFIDVLGVCKSAADIQEVTAKKTGELLKKRDVTLVDDSVGAVMLTLWEEKAEKFEGTTHPVIAVKGVRLKEFEGSKFLACWSDTMLQPNPDLPEAHKLRGWYDNGGADTEFFNVSARVMLTSNSGGNNKWITFSDAKARQLDNNNYYNLLGVLIFAYADNVLYKACPQDNCNKKLKILENELFECKKCNRKYPNYKYRFILSGNVSDPTGDQLITAFNESSEAMLGITSAEIGSLFENDIMKYVQIFEDVKFKTFVFKFRTKIDTYKGEAHLKTTVIDVQPINYKDANSKLISSIKSITGVDV